MKALTLALLTALTLASPSFAQQLSPGSGVSGGPTTSTESSSVVNLNSASIDELCTLPGIGKKKAEAIIALRTRRPLTRVTQLLQVKGIGPRTLQRLKPLLSVAPPPTPTGPEVPAVSGVPIMASVHR